MKITFLDTSSEHRGFGFGVTSGIITALGMIMGLYSSTDSFLVVIAGILSIAVADSFSDALGIHVSEESVTKKHERAWAAALYTFMSKLLITLSFIIPFLLLNLTNAVIVSVVYGLSVIVVYNYFLAVKRKESPLWKILEHAGVGVIVIIATYLVGSLIKLIA